MNVRGINVTKQDLEDFRRLLHFFFLTITKVQVKEAFLNGKDPTKKVGDNLTQHFFMEEPIISSIVSMNISKTNSGKILMSEPHYKAYKIISEVDLETCYKALKEDESTGWKSALEAAILIQSILANTLNKATQESMNEKDDETARALKPGQMLN